MKHVRICCGNKTISKNARLLEGLECAVGLMFGDGDVILKSNSDPSIHTFFCKPLLVAWLDKNLKIVDIKQTKPFRFYSPKRKAMYVFETTDTRKKLKINSRLHLQKINQ